MADGGQAPGQRRRFVRGGKIGHVQRHAIRTGWERRLTVILTPAGEMLKRRLRAVQEIWRPRVGVEAAGGIAGVGEGVAWVGVDSVGRTCTGAVERGSSNVSVTNLVLAVGVGEKGEALKAAPKSAPKAETARSCPPHFIAPGHPNSRSIPA